MKQSDSTSIHGNDKVKFVLFPEIYTKFVFELMKNHEDIVRAMVLAQVKLEDGTAIDFLNMILGTEVKKDTPMEVGYASFYDALGRRVRNTAASSNLERVASQYSDHSLFPTRSDPSKPIFDDEGTKQ